MPWSTQTLSQDFIGLLELFDLLLVNQTSVYQRLSELHLPPVYHLSDTVFFNEEIIFKSLFGQGCHCLREAVYKHMAVTKS